MTTFSQPLSSLFENFPVAVTGDFGADPLISGICLDSRLAQPGDLFVALRGGAADGHRFIGAAIERGAAAVLGENALSVGNVPYLRVANSRQAVTHLAAALYHHPGNQLTVIGVTGTDGKTTTSNLLYQILQAAGLRAGVISTVNAVIGDEVLDTGFHVTTPDAPDVQRYLARMVAAGLTHVVLETTSHGLAQFRADAAQYEIAVFTNITHEHFDEHGSYEAYRAAKGRLIELLAQTPPKPRGGARRLTVLNRDDGAFPFLRALAEQCNISTVSYGLTPAAEVCAENIRYDARGLTFDILYRNQRFPARANLVGAYNVSNCLAAFSAAVIGLGIAPRIAAQGIANLPGIAGRMEAIDLGQPFSAIADFAHTPNALRVTLETARVLLDPDAGGRVIAVFGSAGLRDREKRRLMAETAAELADIAILTAEDPRTESLEAILAEMAAGAAAKGGQEGRTFYRVPDRGEAIRLALRLARPGDMVLACGKGHEQSMCFGATEYAWDDRTALRAALAEMLNLPGPSMPFLPTQAEVKK